MNWPICHIATHVLAGLPLLSSANNPFPIQAFRGPFSPFSPFSSSSVSSSSSLRLHFCLQTKDKYCPGSYDCGFVSLVTAALISLTLYIWPLSFPLLGPHTAIIVISWLPSRGLAYPSQVTRLKSTASSGKGHESSAVNVPRPIENGDH